MSIYRKGNFFLSYTFNSSTFQGDTDYFNDKKREFVSLRLSRSFWTAKLSKRINDIYRNIINHQTKCFKRTIGFAHFSKTRTNCIKQLNVPIYLAMTNMLTCKIKSSLLF